MKTITLPTRKPPKNIPVPASKWVGKYCAPSKEQQYAFSVGEISKQVEIVETYFVHYIDDNGNPTAMPLKDFNKTYRKLP